MLYAHLYNSPVGDISLLKDDSDLIGVSFSNKVFCDTKATCDKNTFKIIIDQLNEYFFEGIFITFCFGVTKNLVRKRYAY